jgi:pantetheine-phosphate adenylyltransferase
MTAEVPEMAKPQPRVAIYPGTFDPITNGHMDMIRRATRVADHLIVAVARNAGKNPLLAIDERLELVRAEIADLDRPAEGRRVEARPFDNLLMHFAQSVGACIIVRGLRAVSDFEYEFQMAGMNARLDPNVETVFLMASESHQFISSRFVKEIGRLGGDISSFVSPRVADRLVTRFAQERKNGNNSRTQVETLEDSAVPRSPI